MRAHVSRTWSDFDFPVSASLERAAGSRGMQNNYDTYSYWIDIHIEDIDNGIFVYIDN